MDIIAGRKKVMTSRAYPRDKKAEYKDNFNMNYLEPDSSWYQ